MTEEEEDAEGAEKIVMWREGEGTKGRGERKETKEQGGKGRWRKDSEMGEQMEGQCMVEREGTGGRGKGEKE